MDVSDLRKRILRSLDDARKEASARRAAVDRASAEYQRFLDDLAVPLFRQAASVLRAEGQPFTVHTPAGAVRLASDHAPQDFLEIELDAAAANPQVIGRMSRMRGGRGLVVEERPIAPEKPVDQLTEEDLSAFLLAGIQKLVTRA
jgi:hypothetical protein